MRLLVLVLLVALAGCAGAGPTDGSPRAPRPGAAGGPRLDLAEPDSTVRTVQLYRTPDEASLPTIALGRGQTITLEFDLLGDDGGRPLSVYFYHLDRRGRRVLTASEFLRTFISDDIRDWRLSGATAVRYSHYTYTFPNTSIDFLVSGLYVLRVTEPGDERRPLFERTFLVSEEAADVGFAFLPGLTAQGMAVQPVAELRPGTPLQDAQVFDYSVCFARNGRLERLRCTGEPSLLDRALYRFALPREAAFEPEAALYELDLSVLRASNQVADIDYAQQPFRVTLEPDYERFPDDIFEPAVSTGRPIVASVRDVADPRVNGEYVEVHFRYVPDGERPAGEVRVTGAFDDWRGGPEGRLRWNEETRRYEGTRLIKQGQYAYQYVHVGAARRTSTLRARDFYTALVFLHDPIRITDRLVAVRSAFDD